MVCDGPDPPENNPQELTPPPRHELMMTGTMPEDSDDENEYFGYLPLSQAPENAMTDHDSDDEETSNASPVPASDLPPIEPMDAALVREVWSTPQADTIQMDNERARQVMNAMANFALPMSSIPEWAQSISEEQWKQTLQDKIDRLRNNR
ncbi:male-enhanced antigen 1 [Amyelois transitella]|uniref:male-enhanced antigen 1 n=1 Tax=Amyelois transitella TaxID=680683 RepID=UPI00067CC84E|nr:male-enhanced antigen 1 [Amyelois transitella]